MVDDYQKQLRDAWAQTYEKVWGGLKDLLLPNSEGAHRILFGPGRGVRIWTNPAHGGTRVLLGRYEPPLMRWLTRVVKSGGTFYDIGSNNGHIALIAAKLVGANGQVYAFEPEQSIRKLLNDNLELNPHLAPRIKVVPYRVGRQHDVAVGKVSIEDFLSADGSVAKPPTAIKIDVEGAELDVLEGMAALANQKSLEMFVECHSLSLHTAVRDFFRSRNRKVEEAFPSVLEVSRHGYNSWLYLTE
jgi:hypothetical protein